MSLTLKANDKYRATLRSTWIASPAASTLAVTAIPTNVPTQVTVGWGTDYETVFTIEGTSGTTSADYALTGVTRVKGANANIPENTAVNCLNNEEYFNQYATMMATLEDDVEDAVDSIATSSAASFLSRQAIMNGNFDVWQRSETSTTATGGYYDADRWRHSGVGADGGTPPTFAFSKQSITPGELNNSSYFFRLGVNGAGTSFGNGMLYLIENRIENGTKLLCGNGLKVTVSFYAKSDIANKKIGIYLEQSYGSGGSPTTAEIINGTNFTLTSSWVKYTHTFTTNTLLGKTFGTANDDSLRLNLVTAWGSTYQDRVGAVAAQTFVGAGNIDIAQVQLCAGEVALPFQPKSYEEELRACQRYCIRLTSVDDAYSHFGSGFNDSTTSSRFIIPLPVEMRTNPTPTVSASNDFSVYHTGGLVTTTGLVEGASCRTALNLVSTVASGLTDGQACLLIAANKTTAWIQASAEL